MEALPVCVYVCVCPHLMLFQWVQEGLFIDIIALLWEQDAGWSIRSRALMNGVSSVSPQSAWTLFLLCVFLLSFRTVFYGVAPRCPSSVHVCSRLAPQREARRRDWQTRHKNDQEGAPLPGVALGLWGVSRAPSNNGDAIKAVGGKTSFSNQQHLLRGIGSPDYNTSCYGRRPQPAISHSGRLSTAQSSLMDFSTRSESGEEPQKRKRRKLELQRGRRKDGGWVKRPDVPLVIPPAIYVIPKV